MEQKQYLNVGVDYALWGRLQTARLVYMVVKRMGWHDFLRLAWERGAEALTVEAQETDQAKDDQANDAKQMLSDNTEVVVGVNQ